MLKGSRPTILIYCYRPEHLIFHRHLLRSNVSLDLANLLQVGFDLRNTLERKILSPKIKASGRQQYTLAQGKRSLKKWVTSSP